MPEVLQYLSQNSLLLRVLRHVLCGSTLKWSNNFDLKGPTVGQSGNRHYPVFIKLERSLCEQERLCFNYESPAYEQVDDSDGYM